MKRKQPTSDEKVASLMLTRVHLDETTGKLVPLIDREWAKTKTAREIVRMFELDHHPIPVALGGTNHPTNLQYILKAEHRHKTAKKDVPAIARVKRVGKKHEAHVAKIEAKAAPVEEPKTEHVTFRGKAKWGPQKPLAGTKASGFKKSLTGKVSTR